jgi:hypothetical protein
VLRALHLVAKPRDGLPVYIVQWRAAHHLHHGQSSLQLR